MSTRPERHLLVARRPLEFSDAVAGARAARVSALEAKLLRSRIGAETSAAIFALRNDDPTEWRDIKHIEEAYPHHIDQLTDAQLYAIAARGLHALDDAIAMNVEPSLAVRD